MKIDDTETISKCLECSFKHNELIDVIYPLNRERTLWNIYCNVSVGGCGRTTYGTSEQEVIDLWNEGRTDEIIV